MGQQTDKLIITTENPPSQECLALIAEMTAEVSQRYQLDHSVTSAFNPSDAALFILAHLDGKAVGCGALRPLESTVAEVKRMYVLPEARGKGIARKILSALEHAARQQGYTHTRLQTGLLQPEAIRLYEATGYQRIPCHGHLAQDPLTVCFEKQLGYLLQD